MQDPMETWDETMKALAELYEIYYRRDSDVGRHRTDVENALLRLMIAYNGYLN